MNKKNLALAAGGLAVVAVAATVALRAPQKSSSTMASTQPATPSWVVSSDPGPNIPPIGRSLFDYLTMVDQGGKKVQAIPYPFSKLVSSIKGHLRTTDASSGVREVLIPLGRSLQRSASAPDFFRFPRAVVGVDGYPVQAHGATGMLLRDRLFVGYNEKASILEIVSYNESAGRYEYQVAKDYRAGGNPQVVYANRSICLSCHQNSTPIFSQRPWQETNFNADVSSRLKSALAAAPSDVFDGKNYMGLPVEVPESEPQGIDNAKFRANLIPAAHFLWQKLCESYDANLAGSAKCRAQALSIAMRMGFTNQLDADAPLFHAKDVAPVMTAFAQVWQKQWPNGLYISSPEIPNRNPFEAQANANPFDIGTLNADVATALGSLIKGAQIPAQFEPLNKRAPLETWQIASDDYSGLVSWLSQLNGFFTDVDWSSLDQWAAQKAAASGARQSYTASCAVVSSNASKVSFNCDGSGDTDTMRLAGYLSWDATGKASGALEEYGLKSSASCDLSQGADTDACATAENMVLSGNVTAQPDGSLQAVLQSRQRINSLRTRFSDGNLLESLTLSWKAGAAVSVTASVLNDFNLINGALLQGVRDTVATQSTIFAKRPFRRSTIMSYIRASMGGVAVDPGDCCEVDSDMPAAHADDETLSATDVTFANIAGSAAPFLQNCAVCHRNSGGFPPNYLTGAITDVQSQLAQCAERIWFRINMYDVDPSHRAQSPMPPGSRIAALQLSEDQWKKSSNLTALRAAAADLLKQKGYPQPPDVKSMDYKSLPPCLGNTH